MILICPKCKRDIEWLVNAQTGCAFYNMNEKGEYEFDEFEADCGENEWRCPECGKCLFGNEEDALNFLNKRKKVNK